MEEHFVSIGGNKTRYLESGNSDETLLLIHGLGASAERWEFVMPLLEKHYKLIIPDLLCHLIHGQLRVVELCP